MMIINTDEQIKSIYDAPAEYVKVLTLLQVYNNDVSAIKCDRLGISDKELYDILTYWVDKELIRITPIEKGLSFSVNIATCDTDNNPARTTKTIKEMMSEIERVAKRPLSRQEAEFMLFLSKDLDFDLDLIVYLAEYCSGDKFNVNYMKKVAFGWKEEGITSVEHAKDKCCRYDKVVYEALKLLGSTNRPTPAEASIIEKWTKEYHVKEELIIEACNRASISTNNNRLKYADKIITAWHDSNVTSIDEIPQKPSSKIISTNRFKNFNERDYNMDNLEKELLSKSEQRLEKLNLNHEKNTGN